MQTLNAIELGEKISDRHGAQIVTMTTRTSPALIGGKKCPLYGHKVEKVSTTNGMINWSYVNAVNKQRLREGTPVNENDEVQAFIAQPRAWGHRIYKSAFVRHIPKASDEKRVYLEFKHQKSLGYCYYIDGKEAGVEYVQQYVREPSESSRQEVENKVILRDYRISSLESITMGGETYAVHITPDEEAKLYDTLLPETE